MAYTGASDIAGAVDEYDRKARGMTVGRLQKVQTADIPTMNNLVRIGPPQPRYRVGGFYGAEGPVGTLLLTSQQLVLSPLPIHQFITVDEIGVDVTTAGTEGSLYTAIYADRGDGYPGNLVHTSGVLTSTPGAYKTTAGLEIELPPGLYWGGVVVNGVITTAPTVRAIVTSSKYVGETAGANDINNAAYASTSTVAGAPPATFNFAPLVVAVAPKILLKVSNY